MVEKSLELGYWGVTGLGQPIRNLLTYLGLKFEDKRFNSPEEWQAARSTLNTDFPNLPYLKCGDKVLTESDAIFLAICLHHKGEHLLGTSVEERVAIAQLMGVIRDTRNAFYKIMFDPENTEATAHAQFETSVLPSLQKISKKLGTNNFSTGKLSMADFFLNGLLQVLSILDSKTYLGKVPNLLAFVKHFKTIPELKDYLESDKVKNTPYMPTYFMPKWASLKG